MVGHMFTRTRERENNQRLLGESTKRILGGSPTRETYYGVDREVTRDRDNRWLQWLQVKKNAPWTSVWDVGGPFESEKTRVLSVGTAVNLKYFPHQGDFLYRFSGNLVPGLPFTVFDRKKMGSTYWNPLDEIDYSDLDQFGSEAIQATIPNAPHVDVYQALAELKAEGLPGIPGAALLRDKGLKGLAGEHLNYEFGVRPTISAIRDCAAVAKRQHELLAQYYRDAGRLVRRRLSIPTEVSSSTEVYSNSLYPRNTVPGFFLSKGPTYKYVTTRRTRWFSAAYRYSVPGNVLPGQFGEFFEKANILYGIEPTPEKVFALQPWTWLLDWGTNSGEMLSAIQTFRQDPMLLRWGYVMEHIERIVTFHQTLVTNQGETVIARISFQQDRKVRRKATPFGFGLLEEDLSSRQKAILASLGIAKMPFG